MHKGGAAKAHHVAPMVGLVFLGVLAAIQTSDPNINSTALLRAANALNRGSTAALAAAISTLALAKYLAPDILLIDELGYIQLEPVQVGLFFTLMQQRHKKKSTLITSNLGFKDWACFLKNDHLTLALIDRLTEASHVFNMKDCITLRCPLTPDP